jgi:hypothetical protein
MKVHQVNRILNFDLDDLDALPGHRGRSSRGREVAITSRWSATASPLPSGAGTRLPIVGLRQFGRP